MTELDKALDALRDERDGTTTRIAALEGRLAEISAEIRGMERARDLFGPQVADDRPKRESVQGPVMALFTPEKGSWTEVGIVTSTCLSREAIHKFLLRAVLKGTLRRMPTSAPGPDAEYGLPVSE